MKAGAGWQPDACFGIYFAWDSFPEPSRGPRYICFLCLERGVSCPFSLQFWLDFSSIPPASKEISLQGKIIPELGKNTTSSNNFSGTFWVPVPVAFQKLVSVPLVLWCMVITASSQSTQFYSFAFGLVNCNANS